MVLCDLYFFCLFKNLGGLRFGLFMLVSFPYGVYIVFHLCVKAIHFKMCTEYIQVMLYVKDNLFWKIKHNSLSKVICI